MTIAEQFGRSLRATRRRRGFTQETLARMAHLSRDAVHKLETGRRAPELETIVKLADALGIDPGELLAGLRP